MHYASICLSLVEGLQAGGETDCTKWTLKLESWYNPELAAHGVCRGELFPLRQTKLIRFSEWTTPRLLLNPLGMTMILYLTWDDFSGNRSYFLVASVFR